MAVWADVDAGYRVEYQKWHNCEHMTERVSIPGFHVGRRYRGIGDAPEFLMYYETDDSKVLASEPYLHVQNNPTPWTKEVIPHLKNIARAIYSLVSSAGEKAPTEAPYIQIARFNIVHGNENDVINWFKEEHLEAIASIPGAYRIGFYKMDDEVSNISTEERRIHGGGPGQQEYLTFYEIANLDLLDSKPWKEATENSKRSKAMQKRMENILLGSYWLEFAMYAPK